MCAECRFAALQLCQTWKPVEPVLNLNKDKIRLRSLQIPGGWLVVFNHFYDVEPSEARNGDLLDFPFYQDILYMQNDSRRMGLDLGWYPDSDPDGAYTLQLIQWSAPPMHHEMPKPSIRVKRNEIEYTYDLQPVRWGNPWPKPLVARTGEGTVPSDRHDRLNITSAVWLERGWRLPGPRDLDMSLGIRLPISWNASRRTSPQDLSGSVSSTAVAMIFLGANL